MLADGDIRQMVKLGTLKIVPFYPRKVNPASLDCHLGPILKTPLLEGCVGWVEDIASRNMVPMRRICLELGEPYIIAPRQFVLASLLEDITLPPNISAQLAGKSSLARKGLDIHRTAGFVDPGWSGNLTLEMFNAAPYPLRIYGGMVVAQVAFYIMSSTVQNPYNKVETSKYHGDREAQESKYHLNFVQGLVYPDPADYERAMPDYDAELSQAKV